MATTQATELPKPSKSVREFCPLDERQAIGLVEQILDLLAELYRVGRWHGQISAEHVYVTEDLRLQSIARSMDGDSGDTVHFMSVYPSEVPVDRDWSFTGNIAQDQGLLARQGITLDPRQIDIHQLGALLCRMLTGNDVAIFLQSPRAQGKIRPALRRVIERAVGFGMKAPYIHVVDFRNAINDAVADQPGQLVVAPTARFSTAASSETIFDRVGESSRRSLLTEHSTLGPYTIIRLVGSGGMGDVYKAFDPHLERYVAVKVLPSELSRQQELVARFRAEALAIAKFTHPNIVPIYSIGEVGGCNYFVMQYVEGESLAEVLARRSRLPLEETVMVVRGCLTGLAAAHQRQLIHRDIKPGNILIEAADGRPLLADFGLAKSLTQNTSLTATGIVMGTAAYLSPEQGLGKPVDHRADLYSIGVLLYRLLSGHLPFDAETVTAVVFKHACELAPPLCSFIPEIPRELSNIVERLMAKDPAGRFQSAAEVVRALDQLNAETDAPLEPRMMMVKPANEELCDCIAVPFGAAEERSAPQGKSTATSKPAASSPEKADMHPAIASRHDSFRRLAVTTAAAAILLVAAYSAFSFWKSRGRTPEVALSSNPIKIANPVAPWPHVDPKDAVEIAGHRYKLYQKMKISWADAKAACEQAGGHLAIPDTPEKAVIVAKLKNDMAVWVGAYRDADGADGWKWLSGEPLAPELILFAGSPGHWWMATSANPAEIGFVPRTMDGTIRDMENHVVAGRNTNIHGFICEWDE